MEIQEWEKWKYLYNKVSHISPTFNLCIAKYALKKRQGSNVFSFIWIKVLNLFFIHNLQSRRAARWWLWTQWQELEELPWTVLRMAEQRGRWILAFKRGYRISQDFYIRKEKKKPRILFKPLLFGAFPLQHPNQFSNILGIHTS